MMTLRFGDLPALQGHSPAREMIEAMKMLS
jgi:hypothetical protein